MSDYPSDAEVFSWYRLGGEDRYAATSVARRAVDWARANPAPQEPPTRECACLGSCKGSAGLAPGWTCALARPRPAEPTEAPKPTSGDKPPTTMSKLWFRMNAHAKEEEPDPRNPSPWPPKGGETP